MSVLNKKEREKRKIESIRSYFISKAINEGKTIYDPYGPLIMTGRSLDPIVILENLEKVLNSKSISEKERNNLVVLGNLFISQLHCGICQREEEQFLSVIEPEPHICSLTGKSTRSFDEVQLNIPCTPNNCPIKLKCLK